MGCSNSKIEDEEAVSKCRMQKQFVKQAIKSRNALASAHSSYVQALHSVGSIFGQLAETQLQLPNHPLPSATIIRHASAPPLPPLPPPPSFRAASAKIPRSVSLSPALPKKLPFSEKVKVSRHKASLSPPKMELFPPEVELFPPKMVLSPSKVNPSPPKVLSSPEVVISPPKVLPFPPNVELSPPKVLPAPPVSPSTKEEDSKLQKNFVDENPPAKMEKDEEPLSDPDSPPSPLSNNFGWDWFDLFQPPPMPLHLQEQRRYKHMRGEEHLEQEVEDELRVVEIEDLHLEENHNHEVKGLKTQEGEEAEQQDNQKGRMQDPGEESNRQKKQEAEQKTKEEMPAETTDSDISSEIPHEVEEERNAEMTAIVLREPRNLLEVLREIDEEFLEAAESGKDVSHVLEASKGHHRSAFLDSRGLSEHSTRLLRGLSWSSKSPDIPVSWAGVESSDYSITEEFGVVGNHASTLDKLYAWEKKLYEEVKAMEMINIEFEKKRRLLRHLDAKRDVYAKVEKTRATIKALENQIMVSIQAMEATSSSIKKVTVEEMYPELLELLEGFKKMWKAMFKCHRQQKNALFLTRIPESLSGESISSFQRQAFSQLEIALSNWHAVFSRTFSAQREYIHSVHSWLQLSLIKQEKESKYRASLAKRVNPPMWQLCEDWKAALDKLQVQEKHAVEAIRKFTEIVGSVIRLQTEDPKSQKSPEFLSRNLSSTFLNYPENSYVEALQLKKSLLLGRQDPADINEEDGDTEIVKPTPESRVNPLKSLQDSLPDLFQALLEFAGECMRAYEDIFSKAKKKKTRDCKQLKIFCDNLPDLQVYKAVEIIVIFAWCEVNCTFCNE